MVRQRTQKQVRRGKGPTWKSERVNGCKRIGGRVRSVLTVIRRSKKRVHGGISEDYLAHKEVCKSETIEF